MKTLKSIALVFAFVGGFAFAASAQTSLTKLDGGSVDIEAQKGKVVVLAVGASWLPLSNKQAEYTNTLAKNTPVKTSCSTL